MTTTGDLDADIDAGKLIGAEEENGLVELSAEDLRSVELQRDTVDLDEALALNAPRDGCRRELSVIRDIFAVSKWEAIVPVAFFFLPKTWTAWAAMLSMGAQMASSFVSSGRV
jgi:hypothetical protein